MQSLAWAWCLAWPPVQAAAADRGGQFRRDRVERRKRRRRRRIDVAGAQAIVAKYLNPPQSLGLPPLSKKPPAGE